MLFYKSRGLETSLLPWQPQNLNNFLQFSGLYPHAKFQEISFNNLKNIHDLTNVKMLFKTYDAIAHLI